jgi:hypothetical protein
MLEFLSDFYLPWTEIQECASCSLGPLNEQYLGTGKCLIGFDYSMSSLVEREYVCTITRWMALQIGRRKSRFRGGTLERPVPYYVYDSNEARPILGPEWVDSGFPWGLYDNYGIRLGEVLARELAWHNIPKGAYEKIGATHHGRSSEEVREALIQEGLEGAYNTLNLMRAQITRLDVLWKSL